jgi:hypothetical protein
MRVECIQDGHALNSLSSPDIQQDEEVKTFSLTSDGARHWLRANVVSPAGDIQLLGNPVYVNFAK